MASAPVTFAKLEKGFCWGNSWSGGCVRLSGEFKAMLTLSVQSLQDNWGSAEGIEMNVTAQRSIHSCGCDLFTSQSGNALWCFQSIYTDKFFIWMLTVDVICTHLLRARGFKDTPARYWMEKGRQRSKTPPGLSDTTQHNLVCHVNIKIESSWYVIVSVAVVYRVVALLLLQASFRLGMESEIKLYEHECNIVLSFWVFVEAIQP